MYGLIDDVNSEKITEAFKKAIIDILRLGERAEGGLNSEYLSATLNRNGWPITVYTIDREYNASKMSTNYKVDFYFKGNEYIFYVLVHDREIVKAGTDVKLEEVKEKIISCFNDTAENLRDFSGHPPELVDEQIAAALKVLVDEWMMDGLVTTSP